MTGRQAAKTRAQFIKESEELLQQVTVLDDSETMAHQLEASELRYRCLFEAAQDGILILDAATAQIVDVNPFLVEMLGYSKEEFLGKKLWEVGAFRNIEAAKSAFSKLQSEHYIRYEDMPLKAKNGELINVEFVSNVYDADSIKVIQCNIRDITERKHVEDALAKVRNELETKVKERTSQLAKTNEELVQEITDGKQAKERIIRLNSVLTTIRSINQLIAHEMDRQRLIQRSCDLLVRTPSYRLAWILLVDEARHFVSLAVAGLGESLISDLSDRFRRGEYLQCAREILSQRSSFVACDDVEARHKGCPLTGYHAGGAGFTSRLEYEGKIYGTISVDVPRDIVMDTKEQGLFKELAEDISFALANIDRGEQRQRVEEQLKRSEERFRTIYEFAPDAYFLHDTEGNFVDCNRAAEKTSGYEKKEVIGKSFLTLNMLGSDDLPKAAMILSKNALSQPTGPDEFSVIRKGGNQVTVEISTFPVEIEGKSLVVSIAHDITTRKQAEKALKVSIGALAASEKRYSTIFESAAEGILIADIATQQFKYANPAIGRMLGYSQEELQEMAVGDIHPKDTLKHVVSEFEAQAKGKKTLSEGIPCLRKDGVILYADVKTAQALLDGTMCNLSFFTDITERTLAEKEKRQNIEKLINSMDATINVLAMTVEIRDPYTAGHQQRVSSLATCIAEEMGLPAEQIKGIRIAGAIHDIGKMYVPSEILSKPGRLSEIEFSLIKIHPQAGYDILKIVEFPWPIAQTVLQHHERMDGSGYPGHLLSKDIILEARILAVADVVEAMASHRPYRPALGIDRALDEISQKKGLLYDSEVVDACLKLFNEKRFKFGGEIPIAIGSPLKIG